jgi:hypothetical protein
MTLDLAEIARLFAERGDVAYAGEPVSQTEHALQCAWLAEQAGASDALVTAALLHDLGHLLIAEHQTLSRSPTELGIDDRHQYIALPLLRGAFDAEVREPIRLHVDAKRYLCATRPATSRSSRPIRCAAWRCRAARWTTRRPGALPRSNGPATRCACGCGTRSEGRRAEDAAAGALPRDGGQGDASLIAVFGMSFECPANAPVKAPVRPAAYRYFRPV